MSTHIIGLNGELTKITIKGLKIGHPGSDTAVNTLKLKQTGFTLCLFIILLVQFGLLSGHLLGNSCPLG